MYQKTDRFEPSTLWGASVCVPPIPATGLAAAFHPNLPRPLSTQSGSTALGLEAAHRELKISPAEFDEVAAELGRTLVLFKVSKRETDEVLAAFAAHKGEVTEGYAAERVREPVHS
jgi:hypothetical protein